MRVLKRSLASIIVFVMLLSSVQTGLLNCAAADEAPVAPTNIPAIYIDLDGDAPLESVGKDVYVGGTVSVVGDTQNPDIIGVRGNLKGRGNYSWSAPKKPYNLKFETKTDLLGMGAAKKWVMIANYWDKTMLRNYITLMMAAEIGLNYAVEVRFADLYVNGKYQGNYLVTEKVEIGKQRVNIDDADGSVLFEIEQAYRHGNGAECQYCHQVGSGVHLTYKEPEAKDLTEEKMAQIMSNTNDFLDKLDASLYSGYSEYSKYIDVDSFIKWYIVNEFCKNYDSQFVTSCYCYYDTSDGKLHMGPPWDYDTCYGNQDPGGYGRPEGFFIKDGAPWYRILFNDSRFVELVKEEWTRAKSEGVISGVLSNIIEGAELIDASQKLNFQAWPGMLTDGGPKGGGEGYYFTTHKEEVDYLKKFVAIRSVWLDEQLNTDFNSSANKIDNLNILAKGMLMDNSMAKDQTYVDKAYSIYNSLTPVETALLDEEVSKLFSDMEIYEVESAIRAAAAVTEYSGRSIVEQARQMYNALPGEDKIRVTNYADLLLAEERMKQLAENYGIANVTKQELTGLVDKNSINAPDGFGNETVENLFDGNTGTKYCTDANLPLTIKWSMSEPVAVSVYALATANDSPDRDPKAWTLEGSNDGESWTVIDTVTNGELSEERFRFKEFFCDKPDTYQHYRLVITETKGGPISQLSEIMLGGNPDEKVTAVIDAIDAIGVVEDLSKQAIVEAARALYDALGDGEKEKVTNFDKLLAAEIAIANLIGVDSEIQAVIDSIDRLPEEITLDDEAAVNAAKTAYNALSDARKTLVSNYKKLIAAEQKLSVLIEERDNIAAAAAVDALIDNIGEVTGPEQLPAINAARAAYNRLTDAQKALVTKLDILTAAEKTRAEVYKIPAVLSAIDAIGDPVTYKDAPEVIKARRLYDELSAEDQKQITNYDKLTSAEKALSALHSLFNVEVHRRSDQEYGNGYNVTPWMNADNITDEEIDLSLSAMADEIRYLYTNKGYSMGLLDGYYETGNHGGYLIVQSDIRKYPGTAIDSDDVGNPWGSPGRYWSCVIAPFVGMAFGVNGYFSTPAFNYDMPLGDSFEYEGQTYQVYASCTKSYETAPLVKDTCPEIERHEAYPGMGDENNNNTFIYAYANYSQQNKSEDRVLGVPLTAVQLSSDGSVKYQRFVSDDGTAYIAGSVSAIAAADASGGHPTGAYTVSGSVAQALEDMFGTDSEIFDAVGAPVSEAYDRNGKTVQMFGNGAVIVDENGNPQFLEGVSESDVSAAAAVDELIEAIGDKVTLTSADAIGAARETYDRLTDAQKELVKLEDTLVKAEEKLADLIAVDEVEKLILALPDSGELEEILMDEPERLAEISAEVDKVNDAYEALTPTQKVMVDEDLLCELDMLKEMIDSNGPWPIPVLRGDLDNNRVVNVSDIMMLKNLIMSGNWNNDYLRRGDMDGNGTLNVSDMLAIKALIMAG